MTFSDLSTVTGDGMVDALFPKSSPNITMDTSNEIIILQDPSLSEEEKMVALDVLSYKMRQPNAQRYVQGIFFWMFNTSTLS